MSASGLLRSDVGAYVELCEDAKGKIVGDATCRSGQCVGKCRAENESCVLDVLVDSTPAKIIFCCDPGLVCGANNLCIENPFPPSCPDCILASTTIALTSDETRLVVVNREANSLSIIQVKDANGNDVAHKLAEIGVGEEPRCVAVHPTDRAAYVTNGISGTVSVVDLVLGRVVATIPWAPSREAAP